jgi:hypothetical protein
MADAPKNPGRELAKLRWRGRVVDRAVETVAERSDELDAAQPERMRAVVDAREAS